MKKQTQWCFAIMLAGMPFWSSAQLLKGKADGGLVNQVLSSFFA